MRKIVVSIINFRTPQMTCECVASVLQDIQGIDAEIVIVDNASGDGSADVIADWIAQQPEGAPLTLVRSPTNSGFSGGHNQGIGAAQGAYYLVLNSDALIRPGFFKTILDIADANPKAGLISPSILSEAGEPEVGAFRFHSPLSELIRAAETGPLTKLLKNHVVALQPPANPLEVEWVSFACVLLRGRMVNEIGPMDEGYFLYFEDSEYCLRARRAGWGIAYAPDAAAVHYQGGSSTLVEDEKARKRLPAYYYASRTRFLYQAHGRPGLWIANMLWHLGRLIANARRLFGKPIPAANVAEHRDLWINATNPLGPRYAPGDPT
jgi:GT2 family glycosyltransferase